MKITGCRVRALMTGAVALLTVTACTRSASELTDPVADEPSTSTTATATTVTEPTDDDPTGDGATSSSPAVFDEGSTTLPTSDSVAPTSVAAIEEIGTPGLDSEDRFCAAWSRFAGSFQVVAVTAAFGSGPPEALAALEVAASPVVTESYESLFANWPDELEAEEELVADQFLGPFHRRLDEAYAALVATGVDAATIDAIAAAWVDGLARRDPSTPEFTIDLPDESWGVIDAAAAEFARSRVPFGSDPSLVTAVETPLTSEYLAVSCPDQGTLSGQEVDAP